MGDEKMFTTYCRTTMSTVAMIPSSVFLLFMSLPWFKRTNVVKLRFKLSSAMTITQEEGDEYFSMDSREFLKLILSNNILYTANRFAIS